MDNKIEDDWRTRKAGHRSVSASDNIGIWLSATGHALE
tara:strand:- start:135 stop:248 length:114 start_codon:yes stop_codon:yes gene_type:complete